MTPGGGGGGRKRVATPTLTGWETWWEYNKEPFLDLRARLHVAPRTQQSVADALSGKDDPERVPLAVVVQQILPVLKESARDNDDDVADSAVLALARMIPPERATLVIDDVLGALANDAQSVRQSALLGLGLLRDPRVMQPLTSVLDGSEDGRRLLREKGQVDDLARGFAALALGLTHDSSAIDSLKRAFTRSDSDEVRAAIVLALGEFAADPDAPPKLVPWLLDRMDDEALNDVVRTQAPIALSRLGECARPALPELVKCVTSKRMPDGVRQSAAIAIGKIAAPEDVEAVAALKSIVESSNDEGASHFALISLGEIGAAAARDADKHDPVVDDLVRFLYRAIARPVNQHHLPFAVTALALFGRGFRKDAPQRSEFANKIADALGDTKNPTHVGAIAVALGLLEARVHGPALVKLLEDTGDRQLRGHLAEAVGLMGYSAAAPILNKMLADEDDTAYRLQIATGLGLLSDPAVNGTLIARLDRMKTLWETASTAKALGLVGDVDAVEPLLKLVTNKQRPGLTRGFCCVALGLLAERTLLPWNARLKYGSNYLVPFRVQAEVLDIL